MSRINKGGVDRRNFLQSIGSASTAALAAAAAPLASSTDAHAYDPGPEETRARYRETDNVKAFYRTNGYETLNK